MGSLRVCRAKIIKGGMPVLSEDGSYERDAAGKVKTDKLTDAEMAMLDDAISSIKSRLPEWNNEIDATKDYLEEIEIEFDGIVDDIREQAGLEPYEGEAEPVDLEALTQELNEATPDEEVWSEAEVEEILNEETAFAEGETQEDVEGEAESDEDFEGDPGQEEELSEDASLFAQSEAIDLGDTTKEELFNTLSEEGITSIDALFEHRRENLWNEPKTKTLAKHKAEAAGEFLTTLEADDRIMEWEAEAHRQAATGENRNKVVLSIFDETGILANPWAQAGYDVRAFDMNRDSAAIMDEDGNYVLDEAGEIQFKPFDVMDMDREWFNDNIPDVAGGDIHMIIAGCPCTEFSVAGNRWAVGGVDEKEGAQEKRDAAIDLVHQTMAIIEYLQPRFWIIENPVSRINSLTEIPNLARMSFQPHHYGMPYTKTTQLWGTFNADLPQANVDPTERNVTKTEDVDNVYGEPIYLDSEDGWTWKGKGKNRVKVPTKVKTKGGQPISGHLSRILQKSKQTTIGGSWAHDLRGDDPVHKQLRSETPEGFAYALFIANSGENAPNQVDGIPTPSERDVNRYEDEYVDGSEEQVTTPGSRETADFEEVDWVVPLPATQTVLGEEYRVEIDNKEYWERRGYWNGVFVMNDGTYEVKVTVNPDTPRAMQTSFYIYPEYDFDEIIEEAANEQWESVEEASEAAEDDAQVLADSEVKPKQTRIIEAMQAAGVQQSVLGQEGVSEIIVEIRSFLDGDSEFGELAAESQASLRQYEKGPGERDIPEENGDMFAAEIPSIAEKSQSDAARDAKFGELYGGLGLKERQDKRQVFNLGYEDGEGDFVGQEWENSGDEEVYLAGYNAAKGKGQGDMFSLDIDEDILSVEDSVPLEQIRVTEDLVDENGNEHQMVIPADRAIVAIDDRIDNIKALIKCLGG
jgi:hypothetical protein